MIAFTKFARDTLGVRFTDGQPAFCKVAFDGVDPIDLPEDERELAKKIFGDIDRIPEGCRDVIAMLKGARMGGTWIWSLYLVYAALLADLSTLAAGEQAFAPIVAPDLKTARQSLRYVIGAFQSRANLRACIVGEPTAGNITIRRPQDGRQVSIECLAASRGGSAVRGRSMVAALIDETAFFRSADTGVINDAEIYRAISPRILPGPVGRVGLVSTSWGEWGLLWDKVDAEHGKPKTCLACICPTLLMRNTAKMRRVVAEEYARDPKNAAREFDCVPFAMGGSTFFDARALEAAVDDSLVLPLATAPDNCIETAGADFGFKRNSSALAVVQRSDADVYTLACLEERKPEGHPLKPSEVVKDFAEKLVEYTVRTVMADGHYRESVTEHLIESGVSMTEAPEGQRGISATYILFRTLLNEGRIRLPHHERLLAQMKGVTSRPQPGGGISIVLPHWATGEHGDLVSAVVLAVWQAHKARVPQKPKPPPSEAEAWEKRLLEQAERGPDKDDEIGPPPAIPPPPAMDWWG